MAILMAIHFGEKGFDRVYAMSNSDAQAWLDLHDALTVLNSFTLTVFPLWRDRFLEASIRILGDDFSRPLFFHRRRLDRPSGRPIRHSESRRSPTKIKP
jgi:hypothetical protein